MGASKKSGESGEFLLVLSTASSAAEAKRIANLLIRQHLSACVNLVPGIESRYWWQGKVATSKEVLLLIKTTRKRLSRLALVLKKNHSYDVPEIIALPLSWGDQVYLQWLKKSVESP